MELTHKCRARQLLVPHAEQGRAHRRRRGVSLRGRPAGTERRRGQRRAGIRVLLSARERFDLNAVMAEEEPGGDWLGWQHREPSDADRLRVNRKGWEVLYFLRAPAHDWSGQHHNITGRKTRVL